MGLKKELSEYTCSHIPQLHEEITEKYSDLLGPLPLKLPPICEVLHEIPLIDECLSIDCLSVQKHFALNLLEKSSNTPLQGGGCYKFIQYFKV